MPTVKARRIAALRLRIKRTVVAIRHYERIESELRAMPQDDGVRFKALMTANAEVLNAARFSFAVDNEELDLLTEL